MANPTGKAKQGKPPSTDPREAIVAAAMATAERLGWRRATLADIAEAAGLTLAELHGHVAGKAAILRDLADLADEKVLAGTRPDPDSSARDRLFDVLMRRFDALRPYRGGLAAVTREGGGGGLADAVCGARRVMRSLGWMLEAAGIGSSGWGGACRVKGLGVVYAATFAVWLRDDTEDLSRTMAALDRHLARAERLAGTFGMRRGGSRSSRDAESGTAGNATA
jgi:AcrR family transcriptional regulator